MLALNFKNLFGYYYYSYRHLCDVGAIGAAAGKV